MPSPSAIDSTVQKFRSELLRRERAAASQMTQAYGAIWVRLRRQLVVLMEQYEQVVRTGGTVGVSWLFERDRMQALLDQTCRELAAFSQDATTAVEAGQLIGLETGAEAATALAQTGGVIGTSWNALPSWVIENAIAAQQPGSPLRAILDRLGPDVSAGMREELINGVALGLNPRIVAANVRRRFGTGLDQVLRISRTEMLRSYRLAATQNYRANADVVVGWIWHSALTMRTCAMCFWMHGSLHSLNEEMDDHPNGRCAPIPYTRSMAEVGDTRVYVEPGEDVFGRMPETDQRAVLGNAAYGAYQSGEVSLQDFVGQRYDAQWGSTRYTRSLKQIKGG